MQWGNPREKREAPLCQVVHNSPSMIDPLWQTTNWLRSFQEQCKEDEPVWWPLISPLTDRDDEAVLALARQLMAVWGWAITISTSPICPPTPMVINIGQFLDVYITGHGWSAQEWLKAYAHGLQHIGEAALGWRWRPEGESFASMVLPLVEAFISMTGAWDVEDCAVDCWSEPRGDFLHQRDEGTYADIISYLDELVMCWPLRKAWDKLVWPPASSVPACSAKLIISATSRGTW